MSRLPDLLSLQPNGLPIEENSFALVGFRFPPFPNLGRELRHHMFINALKQDTCRLWSACFDALWNSQLNRMRKSDFQVNKLLTRVRGFHRCCRGFDAGSVTDTNQTQNADVTFRHSKDTVL